MWDGTLHGPLARQFSGVVVGLDLAAKMLAMAAQTLGDSGAALVRGTPEALASPHGQHRDDGLISLGVLLPPPSPSSQMNSPREFTAMGVATARSAYRVYSPNR